MPSRFFLRKSHLAYSRQGHVYSGFALAVARKAGPAHRKADHEIQTIFVHVPRSKRSGRADSRAGHKQKRGHQAASAACNAMVGTGRFELPTPRTPSECSTRLRITIY